MKPFTEIGAYRNTVGSVKKFCNDRGIPLPTIEYVGTVKLHGTSAGVRITPETVQPQKRTDIVTIGADNAGFAVFCHGKDEIFRKIAWWLPECSDLTLYGEWVGGNIQKGVAVSQLEKHFVIFSIYDGNAQKHIRIDDLKISNEEFIKEYNEHGIWLINQVPTYSITVDFSRPEDALAKLDELTLAVEKECPWAKFHGISGTGEGIVWIPVDPKYSVLTDLWYKTKGLEHKRTNISTGTKTEASPEKLATIREVVARVLPQWRLEQGITVLKEQGLEITTKNTGAYLQWVCKDILKEDADILAENQLEWKYACKYIMPEARQYYFTIISNEIMTNRGSIEEV